MMNQFNKHTILVIDNAKTSLYLTKEMLQFDRHTVFTAHTCNDGIVLFKEHIDRIQLAVCDAAVICSNGVHLIDELRKNKPDITVIVTASALDLKKLGTSIEHCKIEILLKPYSGRMLMEFVRAIAV